VRAGDLIASPAGAEAHQIINTGASELRYLALSDIATVDIIEYPDSGKVGMAAGVKDGDLKSATYTAMGRVTPSTVRTRTRKADSPLPQQFSM